MTTHLYIRGLPIIDHGGRPLALLGDGRITVDNVASGRIHDGLRFWPYDPSDQRRGVRR